MTDIGQKEIETQKRVIARLGELGWSYAGNWKQRAGNRNIESSMLRAFLESRGVPEALIVRAGHQLDLAAADTSRSLYDRNRAVYDLLRYGVKVKAGAGEANQTVWLIDWKTPRNNHFAVAEEVTVAAPNPKAFDKRPDLVLYVNGIALGVQELKRSTVSVSNGIRQSMDSQKKEFIEHFFSTVQFVMAGNESEGLRYGTIGTREKYFLTWKEDGGEGNPLHRALGQLCTPERFLELIHDFTVFDAGTRKFCRHNQYFGVRATQERIATRTGGIIWHTQGSGKSLTMVWLAKWIRENRPGSRVLIVTDRTELDQQIEKVFQGVNEQIRRTRSGSDLVKVLNDTDPWLVCSLVHKFGGKDSDDEEGDVAGYIEELKKSLPDGFRAKGDIHVFVDECHRTQSGKLHDAMKALLPGAIFIGFTGTPLLSVDKKPSIATFGSFIHTYKFDEAVADKVVLDLRYEARDIDQRLGSQERIDQWFESQTSGLTDLAKAQLKQRWGTLREVLSCKDRLERIAADILMDMAQRPRLADGHGNAMLVSDSIRNACGFYELLEKTELKGKCAIITSYKPSPNDIKGEDSGEGLTEKLRQYEIYRRMLASWFDEPEERAMYRVEEFEREVKKKFIEEPGQMKLLIVVDKLLTGFDAPSATYLYIDKKMRDHGLFQAICRVNRLDGDGKDYGYIIDYRDLFHSIEGAVKDYTSGALDGYDKEDVSGLLKDRLGKAREDLEQARESVKALCEPVPPPCDEDAHLRYFCGADSGNAAQLKETEAARLTLYKMVAALLRAYGNIANELADAGYRPVEIAAVRDEVARYERLRDAVKVRSGDYIDLKRFEPGMRHLIDTYVRADDSKKVSSLDDLSLVDLILKRGIDDAVEELPPALRKKQEAVAETIENNVRKLIIDETPVNPKYYERMSELLDALIVQRKQQALDYRAYLREIERLAGDIRNPAGAGGYPKAVATSAQRALYDNLGRDEALALAVDAAVRANRQDGFRENPVKRRKVRLAIEGVLKDFGQLAASDPKPVTPGIHEDETEASPAGRVEVEPLVELVCRQHEY